MYAHVRRARYSHYRVPVALTSRGSKAAPPVISYATDDETWYDHFTSVNIAAPTSSGGPITSYSISPALPAGVTLNTSTGAITGTPTALATDATYTITATGPGGTGQDTITIEVLWYASSITGMVVGFDTVAGFSSIKSASDGSGSEAADTEPAGYLTDLSGNGNHVIQATTSAKPTVDADGINSKRCVSFDGGDFLALADFVGGAETQPNTVLCVVQLGSHAASQANMIDSGLNERHTVYRGSTGNWTMFAGAEVGSGDTADASLHLHAVVFNGASSKQYIDGTEIGAGNAQTNNMNGISLGAFESGTAFVPSGTKMALALVYAGDKTANLANLKTWAVAKFGTPS